MGGGAAGGLGLTLGFFILMELLDTSLRNEKELENLLHLPVLATLPVIKAAKNTPSSPSPLGIGVQP